MPRPKPPAAAASRALARARMPSRRRRGRPSAGAALVLSLACVLLPGAVSPAAAHDTLLSVEPADGETLTNAPTQVVLTFSDEQLALGAGALVSVTGQDGEEWADGDARVAGATVTQALRADQPAGAYTVRWRSVASDGHPVSGSATYRVAADAPAPSPSEQDGTGHPGTGQQETERPGSTAGSSSAPPTSSADSLTTAPVDDVDAAGDARGRGRLPVAAAVLAAVAVAAAALVAARRRERA